jgi:hypothetical protein
LIRRSGLPSSEEGAAYHRANKRAGYNRAKIRQPTEYTENTELQETEIDAAGIKINGKRGTTEDRDRCRKASKYTENAES